MPESSSFLFFFAVFFYHGFVGYPRSVVIIDFFLSMALVSGIRFFARLIRETAKIDLSQKRRKAVIIGAGDAGVLTLKECQNNPVMDLEVVGFIDDDPAKKGHGIYGVKVFDGRKIIPDIVASLEVEEIIIAIPSVKGDAIRDILSYCEQTDAKIKIIKYNASNGKEYFLEFTNKENILFGLLRLRIINKTAIIRELHIYGQALNLGAEGVESQHIGLGKKLMQKAEEIAKENGYNKLSVISGVGVREYYKKLGYNLDEEGIYMVKEL